MEATGRKNDWGIGDAEDFVEDLRGGREGDGLGLHTAQGGGARGGGFDSEVDVRGLELRQKDKWE